MHAGAVRLPFGDELGRAGLRYGIDGEPTRKARRSAFANRLMIDDHDAVLGAHLVRMPALRQVDAGQRFWFAWIRYIENAGAARGLHMADVENVAIDPDLAAARTVDVRHGLGIVRRRHGGSLAVCQAANRFWWGMSSGASVPIPKFATPCSTLDANF